MQSNPDAASDGKPAEHEASLQAFELFAEELPELTDFSLGSISTSGCSCVASVSTISCFPR
jgi:hypothetical protein